MVCSQAVDVILDAQDPPSTAEGGMLNSDSEFGPPSTAVVGGKSDQTIFESFTWGQWPLKLWVRKTGHQYSWGLKDDDTFLRDSPRNSGENTLPFSQSEPMSQGNPSENSARNDGGYGEEEGEDDWESDSEAEEEMPPEKKRIIEGCFNPLGTNSSKIWELNQGQNELVGEYFSEWLSDETVKQSVL